MSLVFPFIWNERNKDLYFVFAFCFYSIRAKYSSLLFPILNEKKNIFPVRWLRINTVLNSMLDTNIYRPHSMPVQVFSIKAMFLKS